MNRGNKKEILNQSEILKKSLKYIKKDWNSVFGKGCVGYSGEGKKIIDGIIRNFDFKSVGADIKNVNELADFLGAKKRKLSPLEKRVRKVDNIRNEMRDSSLGKWVEMGLQYEYGVENQNHEALGEVFEWAKSYGINKVSELRDVLSHDYEVKDRLKGILNFEEGGKVRRKSFLRKALVGVGLGVAVLGGYQYLSHHVSPVFDNTPVLEEKVGSDRIDKDFREVGSDSKEFVKVGEGVYDVHVGDSHNSIKEKTHYEENLKDDIGGNLEGETQIEDIENGGKRRGVGLRNGVKLPRTKIGFPFKILKERGLGLKRMNSKVEFNGEGVSLRTGVLDLDVHNKENGFGLKEKDAINFLTNAYGEARLKTRFLDGFFARDGVLNYIGGGKLKVGGKSWLGGVNYFQGKNHIQNSNLMEIHGGELRIDEEQTAITNEVGGVLNIRGFNFGGSSSLRENHIDITSILNIDGSSVVNEDKLSFNERTNIGRLGFHGKRFNLEGKVIQNQISHDGEESSKINYMVDIGVKPIKNVGLNVMSGLKNGKIQEGLASVSLDLKKLSGLVFYDMRKGWSGVIETSNFREYEDMKIKGSFEDRLRQVPKLMDDDFLYLRDSLINNPVFINGLSGRLEVNGKGEVDLNLGLGLKNLVVAYNSKQNEMFLIGRWRNLYVGWRGEVKDVFTQVESDGNSFYDGSQVRFNKPMIFGGLRFNY